jgi:hypothetical protein
MEFSPGQKNRVYDNPIELLLVRRIASLFNEPLEYSSFFGQSQSGTSL